MLNRPWHCELYLLTVVSLLSISSLTAFCAEPMIAGKTVAQWRTKLDSPSSQDRHQAAHAISQFKETPLEILLSLVQHDDVTVRFWGIRGLKHAPLLKNTDATFVKKTLEERTSDSSAAVRIEAASAIFRHGDKQKAIETLAAELKNPVDGARIMALVALEDIGNDAKTIEPNLKAAQNDSSEYVKRISSRMLTRWKK